MSRRGTAGFTLLEMLVAVSVLGLLSMSIARGLSLGSFAWTRATTHEHGAGRVRDGHQTLQQLIAAAYPAFASSSPDDRRIAFAGSPNELAFVTRLPQALGTPAMVDARLFVSGQTLFLAWRLDLPDSEHGGALPETTVALIPAISGIRFAYFSPDTGWQDVWANAPSLPRLIRLQMAGAGDHPIPWPDLCIEPRTTANSACLYDATDIACRRLN